MISNCVIWTRVSTKRQEEQGGSLDNQKSKCEKFARDNEYKVIKYFGGTHESSKTPGPLLNKMYSYLRKDRAIKYVVVSQIDRFSRNVQQARTIIDKLQTMGVYVVEAETGLTTETKDGMMMITIKLTMAEWDNSNRTDKFQNGIKHCLENGIYCGGSVPLGYSKKGKSMGITFSINQDGMLLAKAFQWKLQGYANHEIITLLIRQGISVKMTKQKLHKILTNPFYAGKIKHKKLGEELVDGNQPPIVSWADFLRVQEILGKKTGVYKHSKENERFPLKRHVKCSEDGSYLTAYTVKAKKADYYKCNQLGCKTNVSAKKLHKLYAQLLDEYYIPEVLWDLLRSIINNIVSSNDGESATIAARLKKQQTELKTKINSCKVRFGTGEIDDDVYDATIKTLQSKLLDVETELSKLNDKLSNSNFDIESILAMCCNLGNLWRNSCVPTAQRIQNLVFPDGILWDKDSSSYRTITENDVLTLIRSIKGGYGNEKEENPGGNSSWVNSCA